ncbi:MAG TPA: ParA family protein [Ornithinibacter sp.]|nr:ParA family protein [Ornithinibacter sp.]
MTTVISVAHVKGGVGKTTTAVQLALHAGATGRRTMLVDADPSRSTLSWATRASDWPTERVPVQGYWRPDLERTVRDLAYDCDLAVIDTPHDPAGRHHAGAVMISAIVAADLVVVPTSSDGADLDRMEDLIAALDVGQLDRHQRGLAPVEWLVALTRIDLRRKTIAAEVVDLMVSRDLPVLPIAVPSALADGHATSTWVPERAAVEDAFGTARVLDEYAGLAAAVLARVLGTVAPS